MARLEDLPTELHLAIVSYIVPVHTKDWPSREMVNLAVASGCLRGAVMGIIQSWLDALEMEKHAVACCHERQWKRINHQIIWVKLVRTRVFKPVGWESGRERYWMKHARDVLKGVGWCHGRKI